MKALLKSASLLLGDVNLARLMFLWKLGYWPEFREPRSLNEKINFIKLYNRNSLRARIVDRLEVREFVRERAPCCAFPPVFWWGTDLSQKVWDSLPYRFVLKANHGSKMVRLVEKEKSDLESIRSEVSRWLSRDYARYGREWFYRNARRYVLAEEWIDSNEVVPPDFKFFCMQGRVELIQVDLARFEGHRRNLYDRKFDPISGDYMYPRGASITPPAELDQAIEISEAVAKDFDFLRVDLYLVSGKVFLGELTNTPENGFGRFFPRDLDFELGAKLPSRIER